MKKNSHAPVLGEETDSDGSSEKDLLNRRYSLPPLRRGERSLLYTGQNHLEDFTDDAADKGRRRAARGLGLWIRCALERRKRRKAPETEEPLRFNEEITDADLDKD